MAKFTMVESDKVQEALTKMMDSAAEALEIKDMTADFIKEQDKVVAAKATAKTDFETANAKETTPLKDEELAKATTAAQTKAVDALKGMNPLFTFKAKVDAAIAKLPGTGEVKEEDFNTFKKSLHAAHNECVQGYQKEGNKSAVEYMKAAGLAFVGALLAIVASPVLVFSADRRKQLVETFFSGVHSDKSRAAQAELKNDITPFVTTASPAA